VSKKFVCLYAHFVVIAFLRSAEKPYRSKTYSSIFTTLIISDNGIVSFLLT